MLGISVPWQHGKGCADVGQLQDQLLNGSSGVIPPVRDWLWKPLDREFRMQSPGMVRLFSNSWQIAEPPFPLLKGVNSITRSRGVIGQPWCESQKSGILEDKAWGLKAAVLGS